MGKMLPMAYQYIASNDLQLSIKMCKQTGQQKERENEKGKGMVNDINDCQHLRSAITLMTHGHSVVSEDWHRDCQPIKGTISLSCPFNVTRHSIYFSQLKCITVLEYIVIQPVEGVKRQEGKDGMEKINCAPCVIFIICKYYFSLYA